MQQTDLSHLISESDRLNFDPQTYLLKNAQKTDIPLIFKNNELEIQKDLPFLFVLCGPGGVGKDTVSKELFADGIVQKIQTATSRARREHEGELESSYLWMREKREEESDPEYAENLSSEYGLIEYNIFNGSVYGIPLLNVEKSLHKGNAMILMTVDKLDVLREKLHGKANIVALFIVPESFEQLFERVGQRENPGQRLQISLREIQQAPSVAHYYIFNPVIYDGQPGLPLVQESLKSLISQVQTI